jgi:lipopolysaccharide export system protein LptA
MLSRLVTTLLLVWATPGLRAQDAREQDGKKIPGFEIFKEGGELLDVMIPRYNAERQLLGVLKAKSLTMVNEWQLESAVVSIEFYHPDGSLRGRIDLEQAYMDQKVRMLSSTGPATLRSDDLDASGHGLIHSAGSGQTFLIGPTVTRYRKPIKTAMHSNPALPFQTAALFGMSLLAAPAQAPAADAVAPAEPAIRQPAPETTRLELGKSLAEAAAASRRMTEFLDEAARSNAQPVQAEAGPVHVPAEAPLELLPDPEQTVITSTNGFFLDPENSVFVYLGDVTVKNPQITLSGANDLKVFFDKKPPKPEAPAGDDEPANGKPARNPFGQFGDPNRMVEIRVTPDGGDIIEASGAILSYSVADEQLILRGGYPWVRREGEGGKMTLFAQEPNLSLRINIKANEVVTEGNWTNSLPLKRLQQQR